jgi:hypothetical protein
MGLAMPSSHGVGAASEPVPFAASAHDGAAARGLEPPDGDNGPVVPALARVRRGVRAGIRRGAVRPDIVRRGLSLLGAGILVDVAVAIVVPLVADLLPVAIRLEQSPTETMKMSPDVSAWPSSFVLS